MENTLRHLNYPELEIIETFLWSPNSGFVRLERHMARGARTAGQLGIGFSPAEAKAELHKLLAGLGKTSDHRVRLTIAQNGEINFTATALPKPGAAKHWKVKFSSHKLRANDPYLQIKTTHRPVHNAARTELEAGVDEIVLCNERDEVCEGSISNLFIDFGDGLITPPLTCGLLPGILRQELLETGKAKEAVITLTDLLRPHHLWMGNSARGLIPAELVD